MEETTREREERLKGWSTFLEGDDQAKQKHATQSAEGAASAEPEQQQHAETEPPQQEQEQEVDSTDSSLAGSDEEDA